MGTKAGWWIAASLIAAPQLAHAQPIAAPAVVDRDGTLRQLAALSSQLQAMEQLLGRGPKDPLRASLRAAQGSVRELDRQVRVAPALPPGCTSSPVPTPPNPYVSPPPNPYVSPPPPNPYVSPPPNPYGTPQPAYPPPGPPTGTPPGAYAPYAPPDRNRFHHDHGRAAGPMPDDEFAALAQAVADEPFSENKLLVLRSGAASHYFLVGQVIAMIERMAFSADKLGALEAMAPRILDRDQAYRIYGAFPFDSDKAAARKILEGQ